MIPASARQARTDHLDVASSLARRLPDDNSIQRRVPYEGRADPVIYCRVLAALARDGGWVVHLYNGKDVEDEAVRILGERADEVLLRPRAMLAPPWSKAHRMALAATIVVT